MSGSSKTRGSRLAATQLMVTRAPSSSLRPPISTGQVVTRRLVTSGPCRRRISSAARSAEEGSARNCACRSAWRARYSAMIPTEAAMVPISPTVQLRRMLVISSSLSARPWTVSCVSATATSVSGVAPAATRAAMVSWTRLRNSPAMAVIAP